MITVDELQDAERSILKIVQAKSFKEEISNINSNSQKSKLTGEAGTGKSKVLKELVNDQGTYFTASTGKAASNIGGSTVHSFSGIGVGHGTKLQCLESTRRNPQAMERLKRCQCLVIDEVSMLSRSLFEKLDFVATSVRQVLDVPYGGMQLVLCGDVFQLPPVTSLFSSTKDEFSFQSPLWQEVIVIHIALTTIHRQKDEELIQ
ncbi:hypothetical protein QZH41_011930, partial [Actinostola sp. cb2023]